MKLLILPQKEKSGASQNSFFDASYFVEFCFDLCLATWTMQFKRIKNGICWDFILSHENNFVFVVDVKGFATQTICAVHISSQSYVI